MRRWVSMSRFGRSNRELLALEIGRDMAVFVVRIILGLLWGAPGGALKRAQGGPLMGPGGALKRAQGLALKGPRGGP